jgi:hypothetical protein
MYIAWKMCNTEFINAQQAKLAYRCGVCIHQRYKMRQNCSICIDWFTNSVSQILRQD